MKNRLEIYKKAKNTLIESIDYDLRVLLIEINKKVKNQNLFVGLSIGGWGTDSIDIFFNDERINIDLKNFLTINCSNYKKERKTDEELYNKVSVSYFEFISKKIKNNIKKDLIKIIEKYHILKDENIEFSFNPIYPPVYSYIDVEVDEVYELSKDNKNYISYLENIVYHKLMSSGLNNARVNMFIKYFLKYEFKEKSKLDKEIIDLFFEKELSLSRDNQNHLTFFEVELNESISNLTGKLKTSQVLSNLIRNDLKVGPEKAFEIIKNLVDGKKNILSELNSIKLNKIIDIIDDFDNIMTELKSLLFDKSDFDFKIKLNNGETFNISYLN